MFLSGFSLSGQCFVFEDDDVIGPARARHLAYSSIIAQATDAGSG
jgi:hypothetical protein